MSWQKITQRAKEVCKSLLKYFCYCMKVQVGETRNHVFVVPRAKLYKLDLFNGHPAAQFNSESSVPTNNNNRGRSMMRKLLQQPIGTDHVPAEIWKTICRRTSPACRWATTLCNAIREPDGAIFVA